MCDLLNYRGDDSHQIYKNIVTDKGDDADRMIKHIRKEIAEMWNMFMPFADSHFKEEFPRNPVQRYWEMYLGCALIDRGFTLNGGIGEGPDFCFDVNGQKVWIEAIAPNAGDEGSPDSVPDIVLNQASSVPRDQIILRFTSGLKEKEEKFKSYVCDRIVAQGDIKIIAIADAGIGFWPMSSTIPFILSATFPIWHPYISIDRKTGEAVGSGYHFQRAITKSNGAEVETQFFTDPAHSDISAVIYGSGRMGGGGRRGDDLFIIHNYFAANPLPRKSLKLPMDYWLEKSGEMWNLQHEDLTQFQESSF